MKNFTYFNPTKLVFGKNATEKLSSLLPKNQKIMLIYGGGSIKKNGVYDEVMEQLKGFDVVEFNGIEPNPQFDTLMKATQIARKEKVQFLLSVGGGSVLDGVKFIAAAINHKGDEWEIVTSRGKAIKEVVPFADVMTLAATGSEMNANSVISNEKLNMKMSFSHPLCYPLFSIVDPNHTCSLPLRQSINGIIDTFVHVLEQFATIEVNSPLTDGFSFSVLKVVMQNAPIILNDPKNYDARANIFLASSAALCGWCSLGAVSDWSSHAIGHELTAFYGLDHGQSLAIVTPRLLRFMIEKKQSKLALLGRELFDLNGEDGEVADKTINKISEFFASTGIKMNLSDYGIDKNEAALKIKNKFLEFDICVGEHQNIDADAVFKIIQEC